MTPNHVTFQRERRQLGQQCLSKSTASKLAVAHECVTEFTNKRTEDSIFAPGLEPGNIVARAAPADTML